MSAARRHPLGVLSYPDFSRFLFARFFSTLAVQMQSVAVGWQVYAITHDPLDLGFIGLAQFMPFLALILIAGQVADRLDRRLILTLLLRHRGAVRGAAAALHLYRTHGRLAGVCGHGDLRCSTGFQHADLRRDHSQPGPDRTLRQRGGAQLLDLPGGDYCGSDTGRTALRLRPARGLRHGRHGTDGYRSS